MKKKIYELPSDELGLALIEREVSLKEYIETKERNDKAIRNYKAIFQAYANRIRACESEIENLKEEIKKLKGEE